MDIRRFVLLNLLALLTTAASAAPAQASQRTDFLAAEAALATGERARFEALRARLEGYPLTPYLDFTALRARLDHAAPDEVRATLRTLADSPLADDLRRDWLDSLARRGRWERLDAAWRPGLGTTADCLRARALSVTGERDAFIAAARGLWLHGHSRPAACDPVFEAFAATGALTPALVWRRFVLAMHAGEHGLARYLISRLDDASHLAAAELWLDAVAHPHRLTPDALAAAGPHAALILTDVLHRYARADAPAAAHRWEALRDRVPLEPEQIGRVERTLAVMLTLERSPRAAEYFQRLAPEAYDEPTYEWRVREALARTDWPAVLTAIEAMPEALAGKARWQYWRGRALEALDAPDATQAYRTASREREFHGFLAAERIGRPPALPDQRTPPDEELQAELQARPGLRRAEELYALERTTAARREWWHALREASSAELAQAMLIAHRRGRHADAIALAPRAGTWDDLEVRFPLAWAREVEAAAQNTDLDAALIHAVMRRESALNPRARSHADARGLMQLLPGTGRRVARALGEPWRLQSLYEPGTNIRYGSRYFADQLARFGGHPALAAAAYNAGPHRVQRWLPDAAQDADLWMELIPFGETREYVAAVLAYAVIYATRAAPEAPLSLGERLPPVPAPPALAACRGAGGPRPC